MLTDHLVSGFLFESSVQLQIVTVHSDTAVPSV